jgi:hypothetical protein
MGAYDPKTGQRGAPGGKDVRELLATTNKQYFVMMDKLKRVVATGGNFHQELIPKHLLPKDSRDNTL